MIQSPWATLGIDSESDIRAIKRAYSKALKTTRPDEDPVGFQLLTDAYEFALADFERRAQLIVGIGSDAHTTGAATLAPGAEVEVVEANRPKELGRVIDEKPIEPAPQERGFDFEPFFTAMAEQIRERNPRQLREWLESHPDMYSLDLKLALVPHVADALARNAQAINPHQGHLDVLMVFFGIDAKIRRHPAIVQALDYLESAAWRSKVNVGIPKASDPEEFERRLELFRKREEKLGDSLLLDELLCPVKRWRRNFILFTPTLPQRLADLKLRLQQLNPELAVARMCPEAVAYWDEVLAPSRIDHRRMLAAFAQFLALSLAIGLFGYSQIGSFSWPLVATCTTGIFVIWYLASGLDVLNHHFIRWQALRNAKKADKAKTKRSAEVGPPGFWDGYSRTILIMASLGAVMGWLATSNANDPASGGMIGFLGLIFLIVAFCMLLFAAGTFRLESGLAMVSAIVLGNHVISLLPFEHLSQPWIVACLPVTMAAYLVLFLDWLHARRSKVPVAEARKEFDSVTIVVFFILAGIRMGL